MKIIEVVETFEKASEAAKYIYENQHEGTWNEVGATYKAGKDNFKNAKNVAQAEKTRQQYERLLKGIESALKRARTLASIQEHVEKKKNTVHGPSVDELQPA